MTDQDAIDSACSALRDRAQDSATQRAELDETCARLRDLLRRDWAVRVLDAWAEVGQEGCESGSHTTRRAPVGTWFCTLWEGYEGDQDERDWKGMGPDAARLAAAKAVYPELPADMRAELGECP